MDMEQLLRQCKFSKRYQGYQAFLDCLCIALKDEEALLYITGIYMDVGKRSHVSWKRVERNIRTMLDYSWRTGGKEQLESLSAGTLYEKPTIGEVLEILTCYLKEHSDIHSDELSR